MNIPLQGDSLLSALYLERERRRRNKEAAQPSYTRPERNVTFYGGSLQLWNSTESRIIIAGPSDCSKAQPLDSLVYTPSGPCRMGDIKVGQEVCTPDGGRAKVVGVYPQGVRPIYRLTFSEGDSVECDEEHLWQVGFWYDGRNNRGNRYALKTTKQLLQSGLTRKSVYQKGRKTKFWLPRTKPVDFDSQEVPLDPYLLGVILGDGCTRGFSLTISTTDDEIAQEVSRAIQPHYELRKIPGKNCDYMVRCAVKGNRPSKDVSIKYKLQSLGLWGKLSYEKFIPDAYLYNSVKSRLAILQGLMDTDGTANSTHGQISFCSTSLLLANHVKFLVESLGGIAAIYPHKSKRRDYYLVFIRHETPALFFRLSRKRRLARRTKAIHRRIVSIEYVGEKPAQCILVDHPDHLYLTDNLVVTHNTFTALHILDRYCWDYPNLIAVMVRKTRSDMGSTVLQTWENKVIRMPKGESIAPGNIYKRGGEHPEFYQYPNGSRVWVVGLDHPGKVLSGEIDLAYVNQAEELNVDDWGTLSTRTSGRAGVLKPGRLIGDANPAQSTHWIKQHQHDGTIRFIEAFHQDNPELYDHATGTWTEEGHRRLANLKALPGVLGKRLYGGEWVSAEGTVFQPFVTLDEPYAPINYYVASVDWGHTNPGVIQVWGVDGDARMYRAAEIYETHVPVALPNLGDVISYNELGHLQVDTEKLALSPDCWVKRALTLHFRFNITTWQCDPSRPEFILEFQKVGLNAVGAHNAILQGIQWVEARQKPAGDGLIRIALLRGSRHYSIDGEGGPDPYLVERHLPTCLEEEVEVYVYPKDPATGKAKRNENPVDAYNHSSDTTRYSVAHVDSGGGFFFA